MSKSILRIAGFIGSAGLTAALVGAAVNGTGAYFTDAKAGQISGTMGSIAIEGSGGTGGNGLGIKFTNLLPGDTATDTVNFKNTGKNVQDVWVVFDQEALGNGTADAGLNSLGRYAKVQVKSGSTTVFASGNLNDDADSCPPGAGPAPVCHPLPHILKLQDNLAPGASGSMTFSFTPSEKFKDVQNVTLLNLPYKLVATQDGIRPDNALNG